MAYQPTELLLDNAVLTAAMVHPAQGLLPKRIMVEPPSGNAAIVADNPTALYFMDEPSGTTLVDHGGLYNGTIESATFGNAGREAGTLCLTTLSNRIGYAPTSFMPANDAPYSVEFSFYGNPFTTVNPGTCFSSIGTATNDSGVQFWGDASVCNFLVQDDAHVNYHYLSFPTSNYSAGAWHTTTVTYDGSGAFSGIKVYIDGVPVAYTPTLFTPMATFTAGPLYFGGNYASTYPMDTSFRFDHLAIWNGVCLTPSQVLSHTIGAFADATAILDDNPSNFWQMDEVAGAVLTDSGSLAQNGVITSATFGANGQWPSTKALTTTGFVMATVANAIQPLATDPFSIEVSFYGNPFAGTNGRILFSNLAAATNGGVTVFGDLTNSVFVFQDSLSTYDLFSWPTASTPSTGWNTWCMVADGNHGYTFYINGVPQAITISNTTLGTITYGGPLYLAGSESGASNLYGGNIIDWMAYFHNVQLTRQQALFHHSRALFRGTARWTVPQATGTPVMLSIPGALGQTDTLHPVHAYLAIDGNPPDYLTDEVTPSTDLGTLTPTGNTVIDITLDNDTVYIAGDVGQGPTLWVEDGIAPGATPNITAIHSADGQIDITLSTLVGTIAAPTSNGAPAVQVTDATNPSPQVLRLTTGPAYAGANIATVVSDATGISVALDIPVLSVPSASYGPFPATKVTGVTLGPNEGEFVLATEPVPANVVSIATAPGRLHVTFDQPLGTGTVISNDPNSAFFVTGDSVLGNTLTVVLTQTVPGVNALNPVIGDLVTLPTPLIDSTNVTGIFQGAIIIRSAIIKALQELREDPTLIRDALASLPQDVLTSKKYGEKTIDECVRWFTATNVPVKLGISLTQLTSPCISVELTSSDEAEATIGDVDYNVIERDPWNPTQARTLASVHSREAYSVIMMVQGEPEFLLFLDTLVRFGIFRHKEDLLDDRGFARLTWSVGPAGAMQDVPGRENFYARTLRLNGFARNCWPVAPKAGQPLGFIESTHFGPRVAPVAQNLEGTATSTPQTPTEPGPQGANPFDPAYWLDRDVISGSKQVLPPGLTLKPTLVIPDPPVLPPVLVIPP